jgi:hypothetical protein
LSEVTTLGRIGRNGPRPKDPHLEIAWHWELELRDEGNVRVAG